MSEAQFWNYVLSFFMFAYGVIGVWFHLGKILSYRKERRRIQKIMEAK